MARAAGRRTTITTTAGLQGSVEPVRAANRALREQLARRIVGQDRVIRELVAAFFAGGHVLLMGVPGLAKTLLIRTFADALGLKFNRIQFTPDLMPSDITGTDVIAADTSKGRAFDFLGGPIFANIILADEINRTPPKTQSALLEAMEEFQVTVAGVQYPLPEPFFVMATQNPIEQEGTYSLPIAALDRFLFKVEVDYPAHDEELEMLLATTSGAEQAVHQVLTRDEIIRMLLLIRGLHISEDTMTYATRIVRETRPSQSSIAFVKEMVETGGSPRAVQALILGAKAWAALDGRDEATPADIRAVAMPAMRHRVIPSFHANADNIKIESILRIVLDTVPRPAGDIDEKPPATSRFNLFRWLLGEPKPRKRSAVVLTGRSGK